MGEGIAHGIVKDMEFEGPPPGAGLTTVMFWEPAAVRELAGTAAVMSSFVTNVVESELPFHCTNDDDKKFEPTTLRVRAGPDCSLPFGEMAARGNGISRRRRRRAVHIVVGA